MALNHPSQPAPDAGWLMYHSVGRYPGQEAEMSEALRQAASAWCDVDDRRWIEGMGKRARGMQLFADLIGAPRHTVFCTESVTQGFDAFITSLPADRLAGGKVLIAADCFPSIHFLLSGLAPKLGFELVTASSPGSPYVTDDDFLAAWSDDVALVVVTWITSTASKRADVPRLLARARETGSLVAVDLTQGVGLLPFSVDGVDFACSTSLKWLCGVPGAGFGYVSEKILPQLQPRTRGWFSQPPPFNWDLSGFHFASDASRFTSGTPAILPYVGSIPGMEWVSRQPAGSLADHNRHLCEQLIEAADAHGVEVVSPRDPNQRGGSVMVAMSDEAGAETLKTGLTRHGLICDRRGVRVRWSPGPVTTVEAIERFAEVLPSVLRDVGKAA